ncbi:hypothetical protein [Mesorhizobium sp. ES1-6]|uniref:hypothetical protein n=1 Tax=Mesorhizobium sp. ES1-6 TaxID=2876626 RepID=UPI001CC96681|nr:hypothetical protein [Mesorhizobium sp. ES1-6]MBZ9801085.1 hypothetical protein [Mesorhizobium sp. ES1-6]
MAKVSKDTRTATGSKRQEEAEAGGTSGRSGRKAPVRMGLHGLGRLLKEIDARGEDVQGRFHDMLGTQDVTVVLSPTLAGKIKNFAQENGIAPRRKAVSLKVAKKNQDNCDPRTDPWCIDI